MTDPIIAAQTQSIEPVRTRKDAQQQGPWTRRLVLFLRVMAVLSMLKGLFHWSVVLGIGEGADTQFAGNPVPWQTATVYFAVIDLVAAVGLWLAAVWGAVVWLTAAVSMAAVEAFFPQIYGGSVIVVAVELALLCGYLFLAMQSAREHPH
jgi:fatty acid desaturase